MTAFFRLTNRPPIPAYSAGVAERFKPTREQLLAAHGKAIPHLIGPGLDVLFCGINPGLYSGATGHHFAKPGNRFWPALHKGGFTPTLIHPFDEEQLLALGCGVTNFVNFTTATAAELTDDEMRAGAKQLIARVEKYQPRYLAIVGMGAYRVGFNQPKAKLGLQEETIGKTRIWVLPNPSGLNAHYTPAKLGELFAELKRAVDASAPAASRR